MSTPEELESEADYEMAIEGMTAHLPECQAAYKKHWPCICVWLRDCEARVREDEQRLAKYGQPVADYENDPFYRKGHAAALDAARDAVAALRHPLCKPFTPYPGHGDDCECLLRWKNVDAAIDALRGES